MPAWLPALITGGFAILVALITALLTYRSQRRAADENKQRDAVLARLTAGLARETAEDQAKREYRYQALTRLYGEVRPLLFQLRELCEPSIQRTARVVRQEIDVVPDHLLSSTQRILAPLVIAQGIQQKMTAVDFSIDETVHAQYLVVRELLLTFHEGVALARAEPEISYRREDSGGRGRQHLTWGQLQRLVDLLTVDDSDESRRPMKLSELEDLYDKNDPKLNKAIDPVTRLFTGASADETPVLWRVLLANASLMYVFIDLVDRDSGRPNMPKPSDLKDFNWTGDPDDEHFTTEANAALRHVEQRLDRLKLI